MKKRSNSAELVDIVFKFLLFIGLILVLLKVFRII